MLVATEVAQDLTRRFKETGADVSALERKKDHARHAGFAPPRSHRWRFWGEPQRTSAASFVAELATAPYSSRATEPKRTPAPPRLSRMRSATADSLDQRIATCQHKKPFVPLQVTASRGVRKPIPASARGLRGSSAYDAARYGAAPNLNRCTQARLPTRAIVPRAVPFAPTP